MQPLRAIQPRIESAKAKTRRAQEIVEAIGKIRLQGNIVPFSWLQHPLLRSDRGKVNLPAAIILSDIIYWYRPQEVREEATGKVVELRRKFGADKLQKSYQAWADQFGLTKRQVKEAVAFLRSRGLITTEFRHITTDGGLRLSNVLFIEPVVTKIEGITFLSFADAE
jgi:hypothetical protein